jgi:hypothetical protein
MLNHRLLANAALDPMPVTRVSLRYGFRVGANHRRQLVASQLPTKTDGYIWPLGRFRHAICYEHRNPDISGDAGSPL